MAFNALGNAPTSAASNSARISGLKKTAGFGVTWRESPFTGGGKASLCMCFGYEGL
jgi:hypothetical protein